MKKRNLLHTVALALAIAGSSAFSAKALTYNSDDLLLGFYATGGTGSSNSLVVNLGQASTYRDFSGTSFDLSLGNIGQDLIDTYGANWATRADLTWGVFGTTYTTAVGSDPTNTLYASRPQAIVGTQAQVYNRGSAATQSGPASRISTLGSLYASGQTSATTNSSVATVQPSSLDNDYAQYQANGGSTSFGYFNGALGNFADGTSGTQLDLFRMQTGSSSLQGTYEGTFSINNSGTVTFSSSVTPVPEPSTYGIAMALAAAVFIVIRRRNCAHAA